MGEIILNTSQKDKDRKIQKQDRRHDRWNEQVQYMS